jgi:hypothetical protein
MPNRHCEDRTHIQGRKRKVNDEIHRGSLRGADWNPFNIREEFTHGEPKEKKDIHQSRYSRQGASFQRHCWLSNTVRGTETITYAV